MKAYAAVLEAFRAPFAWRAFEVVPPEPGGLLVRIEAAGVCGSDRHMWEGRDPRTPLPIILGHEAVGRVQAVSGEKRDILGQPVREGDRIAWDRGIACGACYYCVVRKEPYLCPSRRVYGINMSCAEPPYFLGGYAECIHLLPPTNVLIVSEEVDPAVLVAASCSGATAAHAVETCGIRPGDSVVIQGAGPLGLFALAFAREQGAGSVIVVGTRRSEWKLDVARRFGASAVISVGEGGDQERLEMIRSYTNGRGADAVIDCSGALTAMAEGISWVAPGGVYAWPGAAVPVGELSIAPYEHVIRRNVRVQGVWVSDTSHFYRAVQLVLSGRYPFEALVTHRFPLRDADRALQALGEGAVLKAVLLPGN